MSHATATNKGDDGPDNPVASDETRTRAIDLAEQCLSRVLLLLVGGLYAALGGIIALVGFGFASAAL